MDFTTSGREFLAGRTTGIDTEDDMDVVEDELDVSRVSSFWAIASDKGTRTLFRDKYVVAVIIAEGELLSDTDTLSPCGSAVRKIIRHSIYKR
jgi:hypothetical protein